MKDVIRTYLATNCSAAPLATFRIFFGLLMLISLIRFAALGWIEKLYLEPTFHFTFYGFEWVQPLGNYTYLLFLLAGLAALGITLGYRYRLAMLLFFCSFTYIELMDKTTYLNHYYFVSVMSFLLLWLPANTSYALDARRRPGIAKAVVPKWSIDAIKLMLTIVYFYAGLAKLNSDWLLSAQPLSIWLPTKYDIPLIGPLLRETWSHFAFAWGGAIYDLCIPFLLWYKPTRKWAFVMVVLFHILTRVLFPIGMFPYIMIVCTLIFFDADIHQGILDRMSRVGAYLGIPSWRFKQAKTRGGREFKDTSLRPLWRQKIALPIIALFFAFQLLFPFRCMLYPGELFWTEQGYRFSWRVMLMEKAGYAQFKVLDRDNGKFFYVNNAEFLNPFQEKQMAFQADFILEYAHYLAKIYGERGVARPAVYVESYVALNGRSSRPFVDPEVDLTQIKASLRHKNWLLPFQDEIKGF